MSLSVTGSALVMTAATITVVSAAVGLPRGWNGAPAVIWGLLAGGVACGVMTIAVSGLGDGRPGRRGRPGHGWPGRGWSGRGWRGERGGGRRGGTGSVPPAPPATAATPVVPGEVLSAGDGPTEDWFRGLRPGGQPPG